MSLANKDQILISYMAKVGETLHDKNDQELYAYFFGKVPKNAMLRDAIDAAIEKPNGDIDYEVLRVESDNKTLLKIVIGNLTVMYNKNSGKKVSKKPISSTSRSSRSSSGAFMKGTTRMRAPMQMPMQIPRINFRGRKKDSTGEGIELVALNSLGRGSSGRSTVSSHRRRSSKTSSSKGIEMVELNKNRRRASSGKRSGKSSSKSSRKTTRRTYKTPPHDEAISLTETSASRRTISNIDDRLRKLEESLDLSPLTVSPGRTSTKKRGG